MGDRSRENLPWIFSKKKVNLGDRGRPKLPSLKKKTEVILGDPGREKNNSGFFKKTQGNFSRLQSPKITSGFLKKRKVIICGISRPK